MKFSIIHASARPDEWEKSALAYFHSASLKHEIEYILVCEPGIEFFNGQDSTIDPIILDGVMAKSSVSHWNQGAQYSTGDVIILNSDDMFPPKDWDIKIADAFLDTGKYVLDDPMVVRVGYKESQDKLMTLQVMDRAYYKMMSYAMYPGFQSVYADNDFTACAEELDVVIEAPEIVWSHNHPIFTGKDMDETYKTENEAIRYSYGKALFEFRKSLGYKRILGLEKVKKDDKRKVVAICTPGKTFDSDFLFEFGQFAIRTYVNGGFIHAPSKSCNIYTARCECVEATESVGIDYDYLFWIDSDQLDYLAAFQQLYSKMEKHKEIEVLAGYTYMQHSGYINAGMFLRDEDGSLGIKEDGTFKTGNLSTLPSDSKLTEVDWIGFGCVLMRRSVIQKLGADMFYPVYTYKGKPHWTSEDTGFSLRCLDKGIKLFVDPMAYVRHMKLQEVLPVKALVANSN